MKEMKKMLMYDEYDESYKEVIDVEELKEYIQSKIKELEKKREEVYGIYSYTREIRFLQTLLKNLEEENEQ